MLNVLICDVMLPFDDQRISRIDGTARDSAHLISKNGDSSLSVASRCIVSLTSTLIVVREAHDRRRVDRRRRAECSGQSRVRACAGRANRE